VFVVMPNFLAIIVQQPQLSWKSERSSIANTVVYTAVADKRIRNIWGK
jgi:hypothetical protein